MYSAFVKFEESLISMLTAEPDVEEEEDDDYDDSELAAKLNKILKIEVGNLIIYIGC